ncbi:MAG TPA: cytochrome c3 family protein, partial [Candidatus Paceibacterota bacterium]|nr:cytochrome c3 family protein [Candidatus Paceibacterota bacterium]
MKPISNYKFCEAVNGLKSHLLCMLFLLPAVLASVTTANAQTPLQAQLGARPLTPTEIANTNYALPADTEVSGGLLNVGVGQPVYLEADVNLAIPAADITSVTWTLNSAPMGSKAALTTSPLGANVPVYQPSDQLVSQVAGRTLLRPDLAGSYTVTATVVSASEGTTNLTLTITAGTYMGINTCALCHSGGQIAENKVVPWQGTLHATMFSEAIDGLKSSHYNASCIRCHTVGYDTNTNAVNGGFDDVAAALGWTFPTVLTNGNWAAMQANYPQLANLANIQCENCHGPGSQHAALLGNTTATNWPSVAVSYDSGDCAQCHDDMPNHSHVAEWNNSLHAITTRDPAGNASCVGCHTGKGFVQRIDGVTNNIDTAYVPINCQTCHEPHGDTMPTNNPHMIRAMTSVTFMDGTVVTN